MSKSTADKAQQKAAENGIANPSGFLIAAVTPLYLAGIPLTTLIVQNSPTLLPTILNSILFTSTDIPASRQIPALAALYTFFTFGLTGALSAAGQAMARPEGLDNSEPRKHIGNLEGLPLRMRSAHYALLENFPAWACAAAMAQVLAPGDETVTGLLGLHVGLKVGVHYGCYLLGLDAPRTGSHMLATSAVVNVCWRLAVGRA